MIWLGNQEKSVLENLPDYNNIAIKIVDKVNQSTKFTICDSEEKFIKHREIYGSKWKYYDSCFYYNMNSLGYRTVESDVIKDNNFFIAYGCSHTLGEGLPLNERYTHLVSKQLSIPYLNFGVCGGSANTLWANNFLFSKNFKHTPKFVIIQWPELERVNIVKQDKICYLHPATYDSDANLTKQEKNLWHSIIMEENFQIQQSVMYYHSINELWKTKFVPVIHFTLTETVKKYLNIKYFHFESLQLFARDMLHPGTENNQVFAEYILSNISRVSQRKNK